MEACPSLGAFYSACPFLSNCHMETIFAALFRRDPGVKPLVQQCPFFLHGHYLRKELHNQRNAWTSASMLSGSLQPQVLEALKASSADTQVMYYRRCVIMQDGAAIAVDYELLGPGEVRQPVPAASAAAAITAHDLQSSVSSIIAMS